MRLEEHLHACMAPAGEDSARLNHRTHTVFPQNLNPMPQYWQFSRNSHCRDGSSRRRSRTVVVADVVVVVVIVVVAIVVVVVVVAVVVAVVVVAVVSRL